MKSISIIVPVFNEIELIETLYARVSAVMRKLPVAWELILVDDGSSDGTGKAVERLAARHRQAKFISFARNFGKELATTAGLHATRADAAIMMDGDLQHPPELIPEFLKKWQSGAEIVVGVRESVSGEGVIKRWGSNAFYWIMNRISSTQFVSRATDFRLMSRAAIEEFNHFTEHNRITRGLIDWLGFERAYVPFTAPPRLAGSPGYSPFKLFKLALDAFVSHSMLPLRLAGYLGFIIVSISTPLGLFMYVDKFIIGDPFGFHFSGSTAVGVFVAFLIGIVLIGQGLVALYIANIHDEVINRPLYVVKKRNLK